MNAIFGILLSLILLVVGCTARETVVFQTPEEKQRYDHKVRFLFENEGCRVWSFYAPTSVGDAVYADCRGAVNFRSSKQVGKRRIHEEHQVTTGAE